MTAPAEYTEEWGNAVESSLVSAGFPVVIGPPPPPPFDPDQNVLDQIAREPFKQNGSPKTAFDIMTSNVDTGQPWFTVSYGVDLGNECGWISGDKSGYHAAYMGLVHLLTGRVLGRAFFTEVEGVAYTKINDRYMDEIQTTNLSFRIATPLEGEDNQGQAPGSQEAYEPNQDPDQRPTVKFHWQGQVIETRPYPLVTLFKDCKFRNGGFTSIPFEQVNGFGTDPHTVYSRASVLMDAKINNVYNPALAIYYDALDPSVTLSVT